MDGLPPDRKPTRKPSTRAKGPCPAPTSKKVALQLKLKPETKLWLEVQAVGRGITVSALVEDLVSEQPAGYTLHRPRSGSGAGGDLPGQAKLFDADDQAVTSLRLAVG